MRTWPPPHTWFFYEYLDLECVPSEPVMTISPQGQVWGTVVVAGPRLSGLRLHEPGLITEWEVDELHTSDGRTFRVGTIDVIGWRDGDQVAEGPVAVCLVRQASPDAVFIMGAIVPDATAAAVDELAAGRVLATIEPKGSSTRPVLSLQVFLPSPRGESPVIEEPPVRRVWS
jgi:hypothetical protein